MIFLLVSCVGKQTGLEKVQTVSTYLEAAVSSEVISHRASAYQGLIEYSISGQSEQWLSKALQDSSRFVREEAIESALARGEAEDVLYRLLKDETWTAGERCTAALHINALTAKPYAGEWPLLPDNDDVSAEDRVMCFFAAAHILSVRDPLSEVLKTGEIPLSVPLFSLLVDYATKEDLLGLEEGIEWMEEGARAFLWTAWMLANTENSAQMEAIAAEFSQDECLDVVDSVWDSERERASKVLRQIKKGNDFCAEIAHIALVAQNEARVASLQKYLQDENRAYTIPALLAIQTVEFSNDNEQQKYIKEVEKLLSNTEEPMVLAATAGCLGAIGDRGSHRALQKQLDKKIDNWVRIEIQKALMHIEFRSKNE